MSETAPRPSIADPLPRTAANPLCPHLVYRDVLGPDAIIGLLALVSARHADFRPTVVQNRTSGQRRIDYGLNSSESLSDVGAFTIPIKDFVSGIAEPAATRLAVSERRLELKDFKISHFADGARFGAHIDTLEQLGRVRVLSCVYYFSATPRPFLGGALRLYSLPTLSTSRAGHSQPFVDITPETDTMVVFPSWLRHEVLSVHVPSRAWSDGRFAINCWLHRAGGTGKACADPAVPRKASP